MITLGFRGDLLVGDPDQKRHDGVFHPNDIAGQPIAYPRYKREFRVFRVRNEDGKVESMKKRVISDW